MATIQVTTKGAATMRNTFRFGRRLNLPSTVQIKHELKMLIAAERVAPLKKEAAVVKEIDAETPESPKIDITK
jgi:hypothetical protein